MYICVCYVQGEAPQVAKLGYNKGTMTYGKCISSSWGEIKPTHVSLDGITFVATPEIIKLSSWVILDWVCWYVGEFYVIYVFAIHLTLFSCSSPQEDRSS